MWVVDPKTRTVKVYEGSDTVKVLGEATDQTGGSVVPGFHLPVADIFI